MPYTLTNLTTTVQVVDGVQVNPISDPQETIRRSVVVATLSTAMQAAITAGKIKAVYTEGDPTPTVAAGAGAGSSPTVAVTGTDRIMSLSVTTGSGTTGSNATVATITFAKPLPSGITPVVTFSEGNAATAALGAALKVFMTADNTSIVVKSGATALTASGGPFVWNIRVHVPA
jgi:hypothetical protein